MATPIAHKGGIAGAKVVAMTIIDFLTNPILLNKANNYFNNVQKKNGKYINFIPDNSPPPIYLNKEIQGEFREELEKFYYLTLKKCYSLNLKPPVLMVGFNRRFAPLVKVLKYNM